MSLQATAIRVHIRGVVQGVGFRPYVFNLADRFGLTGWVRNTSGGVEIHLEGAQPALDAFLDSLQTQAPPLARIDHLEIDPADAESHTRFDILASQVAENEFIPVSPDMAICPDCQRELFDSADRRYRYPFINCTNCGPRFTIIQRLPYDRPNTTMAGFTMCASCAAEYRNPQNRRFHAQPIACPECGPRMWFEAHGHQLGEGDTAILIARSWLRQGKIIAVKGLGGFHLACDANNPKAVAALRQQKKRSDKPFALMAFDIQSVESFCHLSPSERNLLTSRQAPIVLLQRKDICVLPAEVAPQQNRLGFMLAYTPLHLLLLEPEEGFPKALVMTSGNISDEPIAYQDEEAAERLANIADGFLLHNRDIHMRVDDSVVQTVTERVYPLRRSRGFAPDGLLLSYELPSLVATGAELKNTFCLTRGRYAFLSHYIGDMENFETLRSFEQGISHFEEIFKISPQAVACDLHPNYLSTRYAQQRSRAENLPLIQVQHHHAHLAACLADNQWDSDEPVIGVCLDGTGYGSDNAIWGGEFLLGNMRGYQRLIHLKYAPLPGGDQSVRHVARMALAHLWANGIDWEADLPPVKAICADERTVLLTQLKRNLNSPPTSSMGRLFDAAAALIGIRASATYEAQAAIELENIADPLENGVYPFEIYAGEIVLSRFWQALITDWRSGTPLPRIAGRFHNTIGAMVLQGCESIQTISGVRVVALSGGVWQNTLLLKKTQALLEKAGLRVLIHERVPTNDGGIALGQAVIAARVLNHQTK
ncbi:MAG: carbamoyltransferase HypF [Bellilinea sp.]|jgi:hydrogenase maturation protein HypF